MTFSVFPCAFWPQAEAGLGSVVQLEICLESGGLAREDLDVGGDS